MPPSATATCEERTTTTTTTAQHAQLVDGNPFLPQPPLTTPPSSLMLPHRTVFYINLVTLDATTAINKQLNRDFRDMPQPLHDVATKLATCTIATPERVTELLATEIPKHVVAKMASRGIAALAETCFGEGPYVVVELQVVSVDPAVWAESQSKEFYDDFGDLEEKAHLSVAWARRLKACLQYLLTWLGVVTTRQSIEDKCLPWLLQTQLERVMDAGMKEKFGRLGLHVVTKVLRQEKQARYFFDTLRQVRQAHRPFVNLADSFAHLKNDAPAPPPSHNNNGDAGKQQEQTRQNDTTTAQVVKLVQDEKKRV